MNLKEHRGKDCEGIFHPIGNRAAVGVAQIEADLQEKERLLAESQQIAHIGSYRADLVSGSITWSDEMYRIYGVDQEVFLPALDSFLDFIHPEDRGIMTGWIQQTQEGTHPEAIEFRILSPAGEEKWILGELAQSDQGYRRTNQRVYQDRRDRYPPGKRRGLPLVLHDRLSR